MTETKTCRKGLHPSDGGECLECKRGRQSSWYRAKWATNPGWAERERERWRTYYFERMSFPVRGSRQLADRRRKALQRKAKRAERRAA